MQTGTEAGWECLPCEIAARVFGKLRRKERCRVLPFVCREFNRLHLEHPLQNTNLSNYHTPITDEYIQVYLQSAACLQSRSIVVRGVDWKANICRLLQTMVTIPAPNLTELSICMEDWHYSLSLVELESLSKFSQVPLLFFAAPLCIYHRDDGICGTSLVRVEIVNGQDISSTSPHFLPDVGNLHAMELDFEVGQHTKNAVDALWRSLASLPALTAVTISAEAYNFQYIDYRGKYHYEQGTNAMYLAYWTYCSLFEGVSWLRQISQLNIVNGLPWFARTSKLQQGVQTGALTLLTQLRLREMLPTDAFSLMNLSRLTSLRCLDMYSKVDHGKNDAHSDLASVLYIALQCKELTSLSLRGMAAGLLADNFPSCLRCLKRLQLRYSRLSRFAAHFAPALKGLLELDLESNKFNQLPGTLGMMTSLELLNLSRNFWLRFRQEDFIILMALPGLRRLDLQGIKFPEESMNVIQSLKSKLPDLAVSLEQ